MKHVNITILATILIATQTYAEVLPPLAQSMLDDLGIPSVQQENNGKVLKCRYGGTKTITVSILNGATVFGGDYNNCRDGGASRDGYREVIVQGGEVIGQSTRRSVNGELFDVIVAGDVSLAVKLLKKNVDVNYAETVNNDSKHVISGWTPLMSAVVLGNIKLVKLLVSRGAWVNFMNSDASSALLLASGNGNSEIVKYLLAHRAYVDNRNNEDVTPLIAASLGGHVEVVKTLIKAKANLNHVHKDGDSALMGAIANSQLEVAKLLIQSGADINIQNKFGVTALLIAVAEENEEIVSILLNKKADITKRTDGGLTALDVAVAKKNKRLINLLQRTVQGE